MLRLTHVEWNPMEFAMPLLNLEGSIDHTSTGIGPYLLFPILFQSGVEGEKRDEPERSPIHRLVLVPIDKFLREDQISLPISIIRLVVV